MESDFDYYVDEIIRQGTAWQWMELLVRDPIYGITFENGAGYCTLHAITAVRRLYGERDS